MRPKTIAQLVVFLALAGASPASAERSKPIERAKQPVTLAVIGDSPYGAEEIVDFPNLLGTHAALSRALSSDRSTSAASRAARAAPGSRARARRCLRREGGRAPAPARSQS